MVDSGDERRRKLGEEIRELKGKLELYHYLNEKSRKYILPLIPNEVLILLLSEFEDKMRIYFNPSPRPREGGDLGEEISYQ